MKEQKNRSVIYASIGAEEYLFLEIRSKYTFLELLRLLSLTVLIQVSFLVLCVSFLVWTFLLVATPVTSALLPPARVKLTCFRRLSRHFVHAVPACLLNCVSRLCRRLVVLLSALYCCVCPQSCPFLRTRAFHTCRYNPNVDI